MAIDRQINVSDKFDERGIEKLEEYADRIGNSTEKIEEKLNKLDKSSNKSTKFSVDIDISTAEKKVESLKKAYDSIMNGGHSQKKKMATDYFVSQEQAIDKMVVAWNKYAAVVNSGVNVDLKTDKNAAEVMRWANAYQALGYDIEKINPKVRDLISNMGQLQNSDGKLKFGDNYNYSVKRFEEVFNVLKMIKQEEMDISKSPDFLPNFDISYQSAVKFLEITRQMTDTSQQAGNAGTEAYTEQGNAAEEAAKKVQKLKELTEQEMAVKLSKSSKRYNVDEQEMFWGLNVDDELDDIQRYSQAIEQLKERQESALYLATNYRNHLAKGETESKYGTDYNVGLKEEIRSYQKYTAELEYAQQRLNSLAMDYQPGGDGMNASSIQVLLTLLQNLNGEITKIGQSFARLNSEGGLKVLTDVTQQGNTSLNLTKEQITSITTSFEKLSTELVNIRNLIGSVDDENGFKTILESITNMTSGVDNLKNAVNRLKGNMSLDISSVIDNIGGSKQEKEAEIYLDKVYSKLMGKYNSLYKLFEDKGGDPLLALWGSSSKAMNMSNQSYDNFYNMFNKNTIQNIPEMSMKIKTLLDLMSMFKEVGSNYTDKTDVMGQISGIFRKNDLTNFSTVQSKLKEIYGLKKKAEDEPAEDLFGLGKVIKLLDSASKSLDGILVKLSDISGIIKSIPQNAIPVINETPVSGEATATDIDSEKQSANDATPAMQELAKAKEEVKNRNIELANSADVTSTKLEGEANAAKDAANKVAEAGKEIGNSDGVSELDIEIKKNTEEWNKAAKAAVDYKDILGETYNVTQKIRTDKDGKKLISYQYKGETGNSITLGENGALISSTDKVSDALDRKKAKEKEYSEWWLKELQRRDNAYEAAYAENSARDSKGKVKGSTDSYDKEVALLKEKNKLEIANLSAKEKDIAANNVRIQQIDSEIAKEREYRTAMDYDTKPGKDRIVNTTASLQSDLQTEQNAIAAANAKTADEVKAKWTETVEKISAKLANAIANSPNADKGTIANAQNLLNELRDSDGFLANEMDTSGNVSGNSVANMIRETTKAVNELTNSLSREDAAATKALNKTAYSGQTEQLEEEFKRLVTDSNELSNAFNGAFKDVSMGSNGNATVTYVKEIGDQVRTTKVEIDDLAVAIDKIKNGTFNIYDYEYGKPTTSKKPKTTSEEVKGTTDLEKAYNQLTKSYETYLSLTEKENAHTITDGQLTKLKELQKCEETINAAKEQGIQLNTKESAAQSAYNEKLAQSSTLQSQYAIREQQIGEALQRTATLMSSMGNSNIDGFDQIFERAVAKVEELNKKLQEGKISNITTGYTDQINKLVADLQKVVAVIPSTSLEPLNDARKSMSDYISEVSNGKAVIKSAANDHSKITAEYMTERHQLHQLELSYNSITGAITATEKRVKTVKSSFQEFFSALGSKFQEVTRYFLSFGSIYKAIEIIRKGYTTLKDLDTALVDLSKTFNGTEKNLEQFYYSANDVAKKMGVTTQSIIEQASAWSRLGFNTAETAAQMAELSSQFKSISPGMDDTLATDGLVSAIKAYDIDVEDVERKVMDNINRIGNTASTSNTEIVEMLKRSSSAMAIANNSIEQTIALETAAVEITRDAESTGTAFKTVSMRIRGYDEETEELSDDLKNITGDIADLTKTASKPGGITLFTDESKETYRSTYDILKDISEIWDELSDKNQAELLEKLAGKRGGQVVGSLINNFDAAEKAMQEMEGAAGSSDAEMEKIEQGLDYKVNRLKETWTGFIQDFVKRDDVKFVVDALTKISEAVTGLLNAMTPLGVAGTAMAGIVTAFKMKQSGGRAKNLCGNKKVNYGKPPNHIH